MNSIETSSIIFYCALSVIVGFLAILADKTKNKIFAIALVFVLSFVAGFRAYTVGRDTRNYITIFSYLSNEEGFVISSEFSQLCKDYGFGYLCKILLGIFDNYTFLLLIFAFVIYGFTIYRFWELRNTISFGWAAFTFYSFYYFETMNVMRQFCAVSLVFFATRYLQKKRYVPFIAIVIVAALLFHKSALLSVTYIIVELFSWKELDKKQKRLLTCFSVVGLVSSGYLLINADTLLAEYMHYFKHPEADIGLRVIALVAIFLISLYLYKPTTGSEVCVGKVKQRSNYFLRSTRIYFLISCALGSIGYFYDYMGRIGYYFAFFQFVYFGIIVKERFNQHRWILKLLVFAITIYILYGYIFVNNGSWHHPYLFVWD